MSRPDSTAAALTDAGLDVTLDAPLAKRVYWRAGGPADVLVTANRVQDLVHIQRVASEHRVPVMVLGKGSNLLVSDAGIRGIVVELKGELADTVASEDSPPRVVAGAGLPLVVLLSRARSNGWAGLACFAGIPGTVGGAVTMNAGSTMGETAGCLHSVQVVMPDGTVTSLTADALRMSYRTTHLPDGAIIATATLQCTDADADAEQGSIRDFLGHRKATQPLHLPSCGSTFRNPDGDHAGRLIEVSGLKGFRIGGASVSDKHANFIVNEGECSAADIRRVVEHVQRTVHEQHGVMLQREVHFVGDWSDHED